VAHAVRIGLTGPIGCGKSTVLGWLRSLGAAVIDADQLARDVVAPGEPALAAVIARFGEEYRAADGGLDRAALGKLVFASPADLADLEAIIHPAVRQRIRAAIADADTAAAPAVVIEAIKLLEGGLASVCDEVWVISCTPEEQRERLLGRGMAADDAERRIVAQGELVEHLSPLATRILDTSGGRGAARARVIAAFHAAVAAAAGGG
jgi:dephospho-CoA kinase